VQANVIVSGVLKTAYRCYLCSAMKKFFSIFCIFLLTNLFIPAYSQCAMCTKTAAQMGEKPAQGLNSGIIYLMLAPFAIIGYIGYRWWKNEKSKAEA
jgi:hypothetical protein